MKPASGISFALVLVCSALPAQEKQVTEEKPPVKVSATIYEGVIAAGYVDGGGYLNFMGPNLCIRVKNAKLLLGMLPSLRIKEDDARPTHNSWVMPTLGAGLTFTCKHLALQVPCYYNAKTATKNGAWVIGFGVGFALRK